MQGGDKTFRVDFRHLNDSNAQASQQFRLLCFKTAHADQAKVTRIETGTLAESDESGVAMAEQDCERHAMKHPARGRGGRMGIEVGVKPDQADRASMGHGLGHALPGPDGAGVIAPKHKGLVTPADAFDNRCRQAFCVMSNRRGRGGGARTSGGRVVRS
jgi:hypothetical protein